MKKLLITTLFVTLISSTEIFAQNTIPATTNNDSPMVNSEPKRMEGGRKMKGMSSEEKTKMVSKMKDRKEKFSSLSSEEQAKIKERRAIRKNNKSAQNSEEVSDVGGNNSEDKKSFSHNKRIGKMNNVTPEQKEALELERARHKTEVKRIINPNENATHGDEVNANNDRKSKRVNRKKEGRL